MAGNYSSQSYTFPNRVHIEKIINTTNLRSNAYGGNHVPLEDLSMTDLIIRNVSDGCDVANLPKNFQKFLSELLNNHTYQRVSFINCSINSMIALEHYLPLFAEYLHFGNGCIIRSFRNIHKAFENKNIKKIIIANPQPYLNVNRSPYGGLGVLKIKSLQRIQNVDDQDQTLNHYCDIINAYLDSPDRNLLECQEELIENNLENFAVL